MKLNLKNNLERKIVLDKYGKYLHILRTFPGHAVHWLGGIFLPPHEWYLLSLPFAGYKHNVVVCSRGTSKSFVLGSLAPALTAVLFKNKSILLLSAVGFRGGKLLFNDTERLFHGDLKSQQLPGDFLMNSVGNKVIKRDPSMWTITSATNSTVVTVPTSNDEKLRGIRANIVVIDERNTFDGETAQIIVKPMMAVGGDFVDTARAGDDNQYFEVSTIDYTVRDFFLKVEAAMRQAKKEYLLTEARKNKDWKEYYRLINENKGALLKESRSYTRFDYTDLLIPEYMEGNDGKLYKVEYPVSPGSTVEGIKRFDRTTGQNTYYTYPVDVDGLESDLRDGIVDLDLWLAENRNIFISSSGTIFSHDLISKVSERPIYTQGQIPNYPLEEEWYAPLMYSCADPCIVGIDYGRELDEFAIVVIRVGELSKYDFDPHMSKKDEKGRPILGKTSWNHIIWAESWPSWTHDKAAARIRDMFQRYNIVYFDDHAGIALDHKGGGSAVRDELAQPKAPIIDGKPDPDWVMPTRLYDPNDDKYQHYKAYGNVHEYWPGLELINATNADNIEWTYAIRAYMQQKKLYIAYWEPPSKWSVKYGLVNDYGQPDQGNSEYLKLKVGYDGIKKLRSQLTRVQVKVSENGTIRFVMPGSRQKEEGKKDLYSACIYGGNLLRKHIIKLSAKEDDPGIEALPVVVGKIGSKSVVTRDVRSYKTLMGGYYGF